MVNLKAKLSRNRLGLGAKSQNKQASLNVDSAYKTKWLSGLLVFVVVAIISFIYHLPASWAVQQAAKNNLIPSAVQLNQVEGTVWSGQAQLSLLENRQASTLGQLHWQLSGWALLGLQTRVDLNLQTKSGGARGQLTTGLLNQQQIVLTGLEGQLPVQDLKQLIPQAYRNLGELQGQLALDELELAWNVTDNWLNKVSGSLQFTGLDMMGVSFPKLGLTPTLQGSDIRIVAIGSGGGWTLDGQAILNTKTYQTDFKIVSETAESMPDWTDLFMQKNSPVLATLKQKGRF